MALSLTTYELEGGVATNFYNRCATVLSGAGWTLTSDSPVAAVTANTPYPVYVWENPSSTCYVMLEPYDGTSTTVGWVRLRVCEQYNPLAATLKARFQPISIRSSGGITSPPTDYSANSDWTTIHYSNYAAVSYGGYAASTFLEVVLPQNSGTMMAGANATQFFCGTPWDFARSTNTGSFMIAGVHGVDSMATAWPGDTGVFLAQIGGIGYTNMDYSYSNYGGNVRYSREPMTTITTTGAFVGILGPPFTPGPYNHTITNWGGGPWMTHRWLHDYYLAPVYIHGVSGSNVAPPSRSFRAKLSNFAVSVTSPINIGGGASTIHYVNSGSSFIVDGSTYYWLGYTFSQGAVSQGGSFPDYWFAVNGDGF